jgi:hypothetical protein
MLVFTLVCSGFLSLSAEVRFLEQNFRLKRDGLFVTGEDRVALSDDLVEALGVLNFEMGSGQLTLDAGSVIAFEEGGLRLYRGRVHFENVSDLYFALQGAELQCWGASGHLGLLGEAARIYVEQGVVDVLGEQDLQRLVSGADFRLLSGVLERVDEEDPRLLDQPLVEWLAQSEHVSDQGGLWVSSSLKPKNEKEAVLMALEVLRNHDYRETLEQGRELLFAQDLMMSAAVLPLLPQELLRHFQSDDRVESMMARLGLLEQAFAQWDEGLCRHVSFYFRQAVVEGLMDKGRGVDAWRGFLRTKVMYNSDVRDEVDNQIDEQGGASLNSSLRVDYVGKDRDWGVPSLEFQLNDSTYLDETHGVSQYSTFSVRAEASVLSEYRDVARINPSIELRSEFYDDGEGRDQHVMVYAPQVEFASRPFSKLGSQSDVLMFFGTLGVEHRDYVPRYEFDDFGGKKDGWVPYLRAIVFNVMRMSDDWRREDVLVFSVRESVSDSAMLDSTSFMLNVSSEFSRSGWALMPSLSYRYKDSEGQVGLSKRSRLGLLVTRQIASEDAEWEFGLRWTAEDSDLTEFSYRDQSVFTGFNLFF